MEPLRYVKCSAHFSSDTSSNSKRCEKRGIHACSKCRLVRYCSKECQTTDWSIHKKDCKSSYNRADWKPTWVTQNRSPAFVIGDDDAPHTHFSAHWAPEYLWGNTPAVDYLQLERNEGVADSVHRDFNLCFAASGDIRNMVMTINGLPDDYQGCCKILLNDRSPLVTTRNILILYALLRNERSLELAAETAVHLMYSSALGLRDFSELRHCVEAVYGDIMSLSESPAFMSMASSLDPNGTRKKSFKTRGTGTLSVQQNVCDLLCQSLPTLRATHSLSKTQKAMHDVMLSPERIDYRERHLFSLKPSHRLSFLRFRESGVLMPFSSVDLNTFQYPNRLLFSAAGKWVSMDNANPLFSWDVNEVMKAGQAHGLDPADIYGCLFFYVKAQFTEFALRVERFRIDIHVSQLDASIAAGLCSKGELLGNSVKFDRVDTSNIADFIGITRVLKDWSPLLNRDNAHAAVLVYLMNWFIEQPGASTNSIGGLDSIGTKLKGLIERVCSTLEINPRTSLLSMDQARNPEFFCNILGNLDVFLENNKQLQNFLVSNGINHALELYKLRLRTKNNIHPRRYGIALGDRPSVVPSLTKEEFYNTYTIGGCDAGVRFLEFGLKM